MFARKNTPVIGFAGRANSGKTTLVEKLISIFTKQKLRVAVIKHVHHAFDFDVPGKDTYRHKQAGAASVILASSARLAMIKDTREEYSLEEIISRYVDDSDLIMVEGFKGSQFPKIEVYTHKSGESPLCTSGDSSFIAVATDDDINASIPKFKRNDVDAIAEFIARHILKGEK
ncbi:MAG: bifunctional molybdopterin-guanine dinucleotide biosynthesis protein MobB/molybdopterin [Deltaproteobacteria bacterium]|nr:bifunctional molybdopterin-guanine dinucleotide biosynthesis protein MobB/molybdopterin [Deltaproteobacteria bacterium]